MERILGYRLLLVLAVLGLCGTVVLGPAAWTAYTAEDEEVIFEEPIQEDGLRSEESEDSDQGAASPEENSAPEPPADDVAQDMRAPLPTAVFAVLIMVIFTVCLLGSLATGLAVHEGIRTGVLLAALGPFLAMIIKGERATLSRGRILGYVEAHPGIHFSALRDALGLANGVTSHHLHGLENEARLISWSDGSRRRFAVTGIDPTRIATLQHPVTGMQRAILATLSQSDQLGLSATDLRGRLEATRQLMSYHLSRLDERALVAREGRGRKATWSLTQGGIALLTAQTESAI